MIVGLERFTHIKSGNGEKLVSTMSDLHLRPGKFPKEIQTHADYTLVGHYKVVGPKVVDGDMVSVTYRSDDGEELVLYND